MLVMEERSAEIYNLFQAAICPHTHCRNVTASLCPIPMFLNGTALPERIIIQMGTVQARRN